MSDPQTRHPELVSGSILPDRAVVCDEKWMLKQVQHDVGGMEKANRCAQDHNRVGGFDLKRDIHGMRSISSRVGRAPPWMANLPGVEEGDLLSQNVMRGAIVQAFARGAVDAISNGLDFLIR